MDTTAVAKLQLMQGASRYPYREMTCIAEQPKQNKWECVKQVYCCKCVARISHLKAAPLPTKVTTPEDSLRCASFPCANVCLEYNSSVLRAGMCAACCRSPIRVLQTHTSRATTNHCTANALVHISPP